MGTLHYGASRTSLQMDDRALAHLQVVITTKLRRNEGFLIQWERRARAAAAEAGSGSTRTATRRTTTRAGASPPLDHEELDRMMIAASATGGVRITAEQRSWDLGREAEQVA